MKLPYIFFTFLVGFGCISAQDFFINEDFTVQKVKFKNPMNVDWNKDFFIEAELRHSECTYTENPYVGFSINKDDNYDVLYGFYIKSIYVQQANYKGEFLFWGKGLSNLYANNIWQKTTLVNHNAFNRLQVYKIDNEIFYAINDQVVYHVENIAVKGNIFYLTCSKSLNANYIKGYYLDSAKSVILKNQLVEQLEIYERTGAHYKIAKDYPKVSKLVEPNIENIENLDSYDSKYNPKNKSIEYGTFPNIYAVFDNKTGKAINKADYLQKCQKPKAYDTYNGVHIELEGYPKVDLEGFNLLKIEDDKNYLVSKDNALFRFNLIENKTKRILKSKYNLKSCKITENNQYVISNEKIYELSTGKEIKWAFEKDLASSKFLTVYDNKILVENNSQFYEFDFLTNEKKEIEKVYKYIYHFQGKYQIIYKGRELSIFNLSTNEFVVKNLQVLALMRDDKIYFDYHPETNEIFIQCAQRSVSYFLFSGNDEVINTTAYIVNTITNEITPFLFYKSYQTKKAEKEADDSKTMQNDIAVNAFIAPFKTFGSYYELDYDNLDYINLTGDAFLKKHNIIGTIYGIGKFCNSYGGAKILILRVRSDQYSVELLSVRSGMGGLSVSTEVLGITQNVNGITTELTTVKINRDLVDSSKYTMVVNDNGKESKKSLTSKCN